MTREDLKNYKYTQEWIKDRADHMKEYETSITNITSVLSDMPRGSKQVEDSIAEKIAILLDDVNEMLKIIVQEEKKQKEIIKQLDKVEQPYRIVLEKYYIQGKKLVTVASEMNYNYEYTKKINQIALKKFEKVKNFP